MVKKLFWKTNFKIHVCRLVLYSKITLRNILTSNFAFTFTFMFTYKFIDNLMVYISFYNSNYILVYK